jgi:hypothetical protein
MSRIRSEKHRRGEMLAVSVSKRGRHGAGKIVQLSRASKGKTPVDAQGGTLPQHHSHIDHGGTSLPRSLDAPTATIQTGEGVASND